MIISHEKKFIFIRTRKCATSSIETALRKSMGKDAHARGNPHPPLGQVKRTAGDPRWKDYFKFAIVRNPWEIALSRFFYKGAGADKSVKAFRKWIYNMPKKWADFDQLKQYVCENRKIALDFVGRYENLEKDWKHICKELDIPFIELGNEKAGFRDKKIHYSKYYDAKSRDALAKLRKDDIEIFGYEFERKGEILEPATTYEEPKPPKPIDGAHQSPKPKPAPPVPEPTAALQVVERVLKNTKNTRKYFCMNKGIKHWEVRGKFQLDLLKSFGLKPNHKLIDVGCGPARGGVYFIEYLNGKGYVGVDASEYYINAAQEIVKQINDAGFMKLDKEPTFQVTQNFDFSNVGGKFDYVFLMSVLNLCNDDLRFTFLRNIYPLLNKGGKVYITHGRWFDEIKFRTKLKAKRITNINVPVDKTWKAQLLPIIELSK